MTPNPAPAPQPKKSNATLFIVLGVVGLFGCCFVGMLAAIAIPNFVRFQARSKQAECKTNLKALYVAQKSHFAENDTYSASFSELQFTPENTRYAYVLGGDVLKPTHPQALVAGLLEQVPAALRQSTGADEDGFFAFCVGSVDGDPAVDVWSISSEPRTINGVPVPEGTPFNDVSDLES